MYCVSDISTYRERTCALRAPTALLLRINDIRNKKRLCIKTKARFWVVSYKIPDCARMAFSSVRNRGSAPTAVRAHRLQRRNNTHAIEAIMHI